jgi:cysteate synthase
LHIAFSGYWPERGASLATRSFKEFEAQATLARYLSLPPKDRRPLLVCSAGNTARGFMLACHAAGVPLCLVVPESALGLLRLPHATRTLVLAVNGDYADALGFAEGLAGSAKLQPEGGARNIARRAGMGTVMLHAVAHPQQGTGHLFDHYFQAIGSGTGAVAAWEAVELLRRDGRFGEQATRIHVAQNAPFCPVPDAWDRRQRELPPESVSRERIAAAAEPLLTNRKPAYGIAGGLFDVLTASNGRAWRVTNRSLFDAMQHFRETEGAAIAPASGVAVDALRQAVACGEVQPDDLVLLHITGGGDEIPDAKPVEPALRLATDEVERAAAFISRSDGLFR